MSECFDNRLSALDVEVRRVKKMSALWVLTFLVALGCVAVAARLRSQRAHASPLKDHSGGAVARLQV